MKTTKQQLKQLAKLAAAKGFSWIAQDGHDGIWYGYKFKPEYRKSTKEWVTDSVFEMAALNLPDNTDYSKQVFQVSKLLNDD